MRLEEKFYNKKDVNCVSDFDVTEKRFEQDIEEYLITKGGYKKGSSKQFDPVVALDRETFLTFLKTSQPKAWER